MGKIQFAGCQDVRTQKQIVELDCPQCQAPDGIEVFVRDGVITEDSACDSCGYVIREGTKLSEVTQRLR